MKNLTFFGFLQPLGLRLLPIAAMAPPPALLDEAASKAKTRKRYITTGASLKRMEALGLVAKKPSSKRTQRGWGPYQSVVKERSVEFNLTLDLQHLRQEIDGMRMTRDLLQSRAVLQRHDPAGALAQTVKAYYDVFSNGFVTPDRDPITASHQHAFLQNVLDENIDAGNGFTAVDIMLERGRAYTQMLRVVSLQLDRLHIVSAEDSVVVHSKGRFRFQIQPETILGIFPHVAANEHFLSRLVGHEAEVATSMAFYFDSNNKIVRLNADMDFVATFMTLLRDPRDVVELLGQALIADNCMIGIESASSLGTNIEILDYPKLVDVAAVNLPKDLASNEASRAELANAIETSALSTRQIRHPQASNEPSCAAKDTAMSMAFILE